MNRAELLLSCLKDKHLKTYEHSCRVADLTLETGEFLGLENNNLQKLVTAAKFHDIGKLLVPNIILNNQDALTNKEWSIIQRHPRQGADLLRILNFSKETWMVALQHHERLDGSGYPNGLGRDDIDYFAKIIAVVDSYSAMIERRPYQAGLTHSAAIDELYKKIGSHFDNKIVYAFSQVVNQ